MWETPKGTLKFKRLDIQLNASNALKIFYDFFGGKHQLQSYNDVIMIQGEWIIDIALQTKMKSGDR